VHDDGQAQTVSVFLILKQDGNKLSGTAGEDENDQHDISKATIDGEKVSLEVDGDQMTGDARRGIVQE
jgi:hypothetical protein